MRRCFRPRPRAAVRVGGREHQARVEVDVHHQYDRLDVPDRAGIVALVQGAAPALGRACPTSSTGGGSDANVFAARGIEVANLACGMREIHTVNEWVDMKDLVLTAELVVETVRLNAIASTQSRHGRIRDASARVTCGRRSAGRAVSRLRLFSAASASPRGHGRRGRARQTPPPGAAGKAGRRQLSARADHEEPSAMRYQPKPTKVWLWTKRSSHRTTMNATTAETRCPARPGSTRCARGSAPSRPCRSRRRSPRTWWGSRAGTRTPSPRRA